MSVADQPDNRTMSFGDHLEELRRRILLAMAAPVPLAIVTFFVSNTLIEWLLLPLHRVLAANDLPTQVQVLSPPEYLMTRIKLSIVSALILSGPWILWQGWQFVRPGLYHHERRFVHFLIPGSAILTAAGVALMYFVMLPLMLQVLIMFGASLQINGGHDTVDRQVQEYLQGNPAIELRVELPESPHPGQVWLLLPQQELYVAVANPYGQVEARLVPKANPSTVDQRFRVSFIISFVLLLMLGIVIAFQMPLVIVLLGWLGLVTPTVLRAKRTYALFICGVTAAVITPQDALSMIMMLVPLYALYELSILMLRFAPATAVAEGTVFRRFGRRFRRRSDKAASHANQPDESAQTKRLIRKTGAPDQSPPEPTDEQGDGR